MHIQVTRLFLIAALAGLGAGFIIHSMVPFNTIMALFQQPSTVTVAPADEPRPLFTFAEAVKVASPAVVNIASTKQVASEHPFLQHPFLRRLWEEQDLPLPPEQTLKLEQSLGSGVIVSSDGLILTSHHVIAAAQEVQVGLQDGRVVPAQIIGADPESDVAVIKVELSNLPFLVLGHSANLQVGDVVLAIGNPFSFGQSVTMGIVSGLGRSEVGINSFEDYIQTDAPINPGNSGGALVDIKGRLIGINTAIYSKDGGGSLGIGFAIPIDGAAKVMRELIAHGYVIRGWLGVATQDMDSRLARSFGIDKVEGVLVRAVVPGSPAARVIAPGDVLLNIEGITIENRRQLLETTASIKPGTLVSLEFYRAGERAKAQIKLTQRPLPPTH